MTVAEVGKGTEVPKRKGSAGTPSAPHQTLDALAALCLQESGGLWPGASARLVERLAEPAQWAAVRDEAINLAAERAVERAAHQLRQKIVRGAHAQQAAEAANLRLRRTIEEGLLDYPLAGGVRLRDARKEQVTAHADLCAKLAVTNATTAKWLRAVADRVPDDKLVGEVLSEAEVSALEAEARIEVA